MPPASAGIANNILIAIRGRFAFRSMHRLACTNNKFTIVHGHALFCLAAEGSILVLGLVLNIFLAGQFFDRFTGFGHNIINILSKSPYLTYLRA